MISSGLLTTKLRPIYQTLIPIEGNIYLTWEEVVNDPPACKAYFNRSIAKGTTWADSLLVSENDPFMEEGAPTIAMSQNNQLIIVYASDRHSVSTNGWNWEIYYHQSLNGGTT